MSSDRVDGGNTFVLVPPYPYRDDSNYQLPMVSGTYQERPRTRTTRNITQEGPMCGLKYRTLGTVLLSASLGASFYYVLYLYLTPQPPNSWILEDGIGRLDHGSQRLLLTKEERMQQWGLNMRQVKAKTGEENNWHKPRKTSRYYDCSNTTSSNCSISQNFLVVWPFHFPQPRYSKSTMELLKSNWVTQLQDYLRTVDGKQVSVVTSSIEHTDILFNWLISAYLVADPPLKNVLVLTLDKSLHDLAESHGFASLYVSPEMVIDPKAKISRVFSQVHIVRLAVVRLMNHYGFDVVNYDCDAILLKNPQRIFDAHKDAEMIGTFGKGPGQLFSKWGVTLNTGVMLLRSGAKLEAYWEAMNGMRDPTTDDQGNINKALDALKIKWMNIRPTQNIDVIEKNIFGVINLKHPQPMKMIVMLMPFSTVCRQTCVPEKRNDYFVWHAVAIKENRTVERKMSQARVGSAWFLSEQWQEISERNPSLRGVDWLRKVVDPELIKLIRHDSRSESLESTVTLNYYP